MVLSLLADLAKYEIASRGAEQDTKKAADT